jgi:hypothetical protein
MLIEGAILFELHKLCATFSASVCINYRLPIKVYVTFIGACANEIIRRNNSGFFLTKGKSEVMLEYPVNHSEDAK